MKFRFHFLLFLLVFSLSAVAQQATIFTQTIRGTITDNILQTPIPGATVTLAGTDKSVLTDANGNFKFSGVPLTTQQVFISHVG